MMLTGSSILLLLPALAWAGGSNYTVNPGISTPSGKVTEWMVPTPKFARDPAAAPDGNIYIAFMHGNKLVRFDPAAQKFNEWDLPDGTCPHGLVVDERGTVWMTGNGNGTLLEIPFRDGQPGAMVAHKTPSGGSPHTIIFDIARLAKERGLWLHAHSDEDAVERILRHAPGVKLIRAHTGMSASMDKVGQMFAQYPNIVGELSYRGGVEEVACAMPIA